MGVFFGYNSGMMPSRIIPSGCLFLALACGLFCVEVAPLAGQSAGQPEKKPPAYRFWTSASGEYKVAAAFLGVEDGTVRLLKRDGTTLRVALEKLSQADQDWVANHSATPAAKPETPLPAKVHTVPARKAETAPAADQWPCWLGPNHDGKSSDRGLLRAWPEGGPKLLWKAPDLGKGWSGVAVAGGTVYITGAANGALVLHALHLDGTPKWKVENGRAYTGDHPGARATPTIDGDNLYLLSGTGRLGCFDARSGKPHWAVEAKQFGGQPGGWGYAESVLICGRLAVFKPGGRACIAALDKLTGKPIWASQGFSAGPEYGSCLPLVWQNVPMIVTGTREGIVAVNARTGMLLWQNKFAAGNTANCPTPAAGDGYVFWANGYGKGGICLKLGPRGTASEAWTTGEMDCQHGGYIIDKGYIYGNNGGGWACLDLRTGEKKWSEHGVGKGSLCWADGMLYLFSEQHGQAALATCSPDGLKITGRVKVQGEGESWAHPVVVGGRLYLRYDTTLYCFDVRAGS
ncbi:MAG: PQQ-binding-like beta-propeller repeat protein [Thermoguttaceae bacterium]|jgi:outer membrane protein assembly factor BamB